ncbi:hypothetical protein [Microvirga thermotolerans]|uniref:Glutamine amidotransferase n=1 Tax=Microvirga thermotolerans TaxID=2651334 RepID=A0A5P9JVE6_9HYPH|nr:hypothetical protein [Microvirga thermotolerans]QFU15748.1 hypothetical protein GDR74_05670 [Microvirga thermotolerans]
MFTLEIAGKAVAITNADEEQARELFMSEDFREDLKSFTSEGKPLWDGSSPFTVRPASEDEIDAFDDAMAEDEEWDEEEVEDDDGDEEGIDVMFLVDVDEADDQGDA